MSRTIVNFGKKANYNPKVNTSSLSIREKWHKFRHETYIGIGNFSNTDNYNSGVSENTNIKENKSSEMVNLNE